MSIFSTTASGLDHYLCYETDDGAAEVEVVVSLEDQFGFDEKVEVDETDLFCNPVAKTIDEEVTEIGDPTAHLTGYEIEGDDDAERIVIISNQFGEEQALSLEEAWLLFVPSEKDFQVSDLNLDHFKCYEAEGNAVDVTVRLEDQFGPLEEVLVSEPELFCNPVDKNEEGIIDEESHLTCYEIEIDDEGTETVASVENQFGLQVLEVEEPVLLCVPSEKLEVQDDVDDD